MWLQTRPPPALDRNTKECVGLDRKDQQKVRPDVCDGKALVTVWHNAQDAFCSRIIIWTMDQGVKLAKLDGAARCVDPESSP